MMNIFIVHAHPEPKSFNGALTDTAKKFFAQTEHQAIVSDLYTMKWNPVSGRSNFTTTHNAGYYKQQVEEAYAHQHEGFSEAIQKEMEKLFWCDVLIFQFPMWWYSIPAILKGWVDKVLAYNATYGEGKWYDNGIMQGKKAMVSMTVGGPESMYYKTGIGGHIDELLFPIHRGIFSFIGFEVLPPCIAWQPAQVSDSKRADYLKAYKKRLANLKNTAPINFPKLQDYNPTTFTLEKAKK